MEYQYWQHKQSGEIYAVCLEAGWVTGVCGPLADRMIHPALLPDYHYDDHGAQAGTETINPDDYALAYYARFDTTEMTPAQIAAATGTAESTWRNKAARGEIPGAHKAGKQWLIPRAVLRALEYDV